MYEHRRNDTGAVFYVGKGAHRKRGGRIFERAHCTTSGRSNWWRRVVAKAGGFTVDIIAECPTDGDACAVESVVIARHNRASLVNLTDGGDGRRNGVFSEAERRKRSLAARRGAF